MSWIKIDDQFANHPKVIEAGPLAGWLHVCGLCYCGRYLTDGFISKQQAHNLLNTDEVTALVTALVTNGLWHEVDGGYQIHDYLEYNPSREKVLAERKANAERQAKWKKDKNGISNGVSNEAPVPVPSPSIPTAAKKPAAKPRKAKEPKPDDPKTQMMTAFLRVTRLQMPTLRSDVGFWWSNMGELLKIANKDPTVGKVLIEETVAQMKQEQLTIASPKSLLNIARAIAAKRRRCTPDEIPDGRVEVFPL